MILKTPIPYKLPKLTKAPVDLNLTLRLRPRPIAAEQNPKPLAPEGNEPMTIDHRRGRARLEPEAPARRDRPVKAQPAEPVPPEINAAFLEDLAFERAISAASALAAVLR